MNKINRYSHFLYVAREGKSHYFCMEYYVQKQKRKNEQASKLKNKTGLIDEEVNSIMDSARMVKKKELCTDLENGGSVTEGSKANLVECLAIAEDADDIWKRGLAGGDHVDDETSKRLRTSMNSIIQEYICPITTELPVDPVMAEDGQVYDRTAIEKHIKTQGKNLRSPITNEKMGKKLFLAINIRNTIHHLIDSKAIEGDLAKRWTQDMETKKRIEDTIKKAEEGDCQAMCKLGMWYRGGEEGFPKNKELAYKWYKRAADKRDVKGMGAAGYRLVQGIGVAKNISEGVHLTTLAAELGSNFACYNVGKWYFEGLHGFPHDMSQARYWFKKIFDGSCTTKHTAQNLIKKAENWLRILEAERDEP